MAKEEKKEDKKQESLEAPVKPQKIESEKEAASLAKNYLPKSKDERYEVIIKDGEEVKADKYDVMYVTSDRNVFFKSNEGEARNHARKIGGKVFTVKM